MSPTIIDRRDNGPRLRRSRLPATGVVTDLPEGALACRVCGVAVNHPDPASIEVVTFRPDTPASIASRGVEWDATEVQVTRCAEHAEQLDRARALVTLHGLGSFPGTGETEMYRLDAALSGLALAGFRQKGPQDSMTLTKEDTRGLIGSMAHVGGAATWGFRIQQGGGAKQCAPSPWAHVPQEVRQGANDEFRALYHRRFETAENCPPPDDGSLRGCGLCGVGILRVKPSDAADAWGPLERVQPGTLGGDTTVEFVQVHFCPACRVSIERIGAPGLPAIDAALLKFLGYELSAAGQFTVSLGKAWAAVAGAEPNGKPWQHMNTARLARMLDAARYVSRVPKPGERKSA